MTDRRSAWTLMLLVSLLFATVTSASAATLSSACSGNASGDFNGDAFDDLAVGVPNEDSTVGNSGGVDVFFGSEAGLGDDALDPAFINQESPGIPGASEADDAFGGCVAAGDFDGDGFSDLAISSPGEGFTSSRGSFDGTGVVTVVYGSPDGLDGAGTPPAQLWHQDVPKIPGGNEEDDGFGAALASGDFDGDEVDDLAIGTPDEALGTRQRAGAVVVVRGTSGGLVATGAQLWSQDTDAVSGQAERFDRFGAALTSGDVDGNGREDLLVGVPGEAVSRTVNGPAGGPGAVHVILAGTRGLSANADRLWHQDAVGVAGTAEEDDRFGEAVSAGDFDGDGFADVAVGAPGEDLTTGADEDEGAVHVLYGTESGPTASRDVMFGAADSGGASADDARFGSALTVGDLVAASAAAADDLAVGSPGETLDAGAVYVLAGVEDDGLDTTAGVRYTQDDAEIDGDGAEDDDLFGAALTNGNYDGSSDADDDGSDLAIGVPGEDGTAEDSGAVHVVYSEDGAIELAPVDVPEDRFLTQDDGDDPDNGGQDEGDRFGSTLG